MDEQQNSWQEELLKRLEALQGFQLIDLRDGDWPLYLDSIDKVEVLGEVFDVTGITIEDIEWSSLTQYTDLVTLVTRRLPS